MLDHLTNPGWVMTTLFCRVFFWFLYHSSHYFVLFLSGLFIDMKYFYLGLEIGEKPNDRQFDPRNRFLVCILPKDLLYWLFYFYLSPLCDFFLMRSFFCVVISGGCLNYVYIDHSIFNYHPYITLCFNWGNFFGPKCAFY